MVKKKLSTRPELKKKVLLTLLIVSLISLASADFTDSDNTPYPVQENQTLEGEINEKFIIQPCSNDGTPFCIDTSQYDQPQDWQQKITPSFSETYSWMVEATAQTGTYKVFVIGNSTNPNVGEVESNRQKVRITSGEIYWENPDQTVIGNFSEQDDPETKLGFNQSFSGSTGLNEEGDTYRKGTQDTQITSFDDISQWNTQQKGFIIPNEKTEGKEFFIQSGQTNPKTCTGQFDTSSSCSFTAIINATGSPNQAYEIFFIGNSTNPNVDTVNSNSQTVGIGTPQNTQGKAVLDDALERTTFVPDFQQIMTNQLDIVPNFTQSIGVSNINTAFQQYGFNPVQNVLPMSFEPLGEADQREKFIIPTEEGSTPFFVQQGDQPASNTGRFTPENQLDFNAIINASGPEDTEYTVFFIGNSTNPNVAQVESNTQKVGIGKPTNVNGRVVLEGLERTVLKPQIQQLMEDRVDIVPRFTQSIGVANINEAFQVYGFEPTQGILSMSFQPLGEADQREKFIIPNERGSTPFFIESGDQPASLTQRVTPDDSLDFSAEINASGTEDTEYTVFLIGNSSNPNVAEVESNTKKVGIGQPTPAGAKLLIDSLENPISNPALTQIADGQLDIVPNITQEVSVGWEMTAGRLLGAEAFQGIGLVNWKPVEDESIQDKGFILPTEPTDGYAFYVEEGPQPQSHTERIEPGWTTSFNHLINTTAKEGNYQVYYYSNSSNPNVLDNTSNNVTVKVRQQENVGATVIRDFGQRHRINPIPTLTITDALQLNRDSTQGAVGGTTTGLDLELKDGVLQQIGSTGLVQTGLDLTRSLEGSILGNTLTQIDWKPTETVAQTIGLDNNADSLLSGLEFTSMNIIPDMFYDTNVNPTINQVDLRVEQLGYTNNVTILVNATDPDGQTDIQKVIFEGEEQDLQLQEGQEIIEFQVGDTLQADEEVIVEDSAGHRDEYAFSYTVSDNDWVQETNSITLDEQEISKNDVIENTGNKEFDYEVTHSIFGDRTETVTVREEITGTLQPGQNDSLSTRITGNYLVQDFKPWTQDHRQTSTDERQYISKALNIENLPDTTWENLEIPSVENPDSFGDCNSCTSTTINLFSGDYDEEHYWQDIGDGIQTEMTGTIEDFEIGERDSYFEQFKYTDVENEVNFTDIHVKEQINDSMTETGGYITVADYNQTWNQGLAEPAVSPACTIENGTPEYTSTEYNGEDWLSCARDLTGNERPDTFKAVIPSFTNTSEHNVRFGGFLGLEEGEEDQPFPGLREDCQTGETFGDLECVRNEWRTESQTQRTFSIVDGQATEVGEGLGLMIAVMAILLYLTWAAKKRKNGGRPQ